MANAHYYRGDYSTNAMYSIISGGRICGGTAGRDHIDHKDGGIMAEE